MIATEPSCGSSTGIMFRRLYQRDDVKQGNLVRT